MKKIFALVSAVALVAAAAVSCQKAALVEDGLQKNITIKALAPLTKVSYAEETEGTLTPEWTVGDKVYKLGEKTPSFTVTAVQDGLATIEGFGTDGNITLYYCPGASEDKVNLQDQTADQNTLPLAFVCSTTVTDGSATGTFSLVSSLLVVKNAKGLPADAEVTDVIVKGTKISAMKISKDAASGVKAASDWDDFAYADYSSSPATVTDAGTGALDEPLFIALPGGVNVQSVTLMADGEAYVCTPASPVKATKGKWLFLNDSRSFEKTSISMEVKDVEFDGCKLDITADENVHYLFGIAPAEAFEEYTDEDIMYGLLYSLYEKYGESYKDYKCASFAELFFERLGGFGTYTYTDYLESLDPETEYIAYAFGVTYGLVPSTKLIKKSFTTPATPPAEDFYEDFLGDWEVTMDICGINAARTGVEVVEADVKNVWTISANPDYADYGIYDVSGIFNFGEYAADITYLALYDGVKKKITFPTGENNPGDVYYDYTDDPDLGCYVVIALSGLLKNLYISSDSFDCSYNQTHDELTPAGPDMLGGIMYEYDIETGEVGENTGFLGTDFFAVKSIKKLATKSSAVKAAPSKGKTIEKGDARNFGDYKFRPSLRPSLHPSLHPDFRSDLRPAKRYLDK